MAIFEREINLIGQENFNKLNNASVAVFGLGGVGSFVVEALARAGIKKLLLCDNDVIAQHNINRQLYALNSTIGKNKVDVAEERVKDINPEIEVVKKCVYFDKDTIDEFNLKEYSYVADCIDSVTSKLLLVETCYKQGIKIISSMGTGNKTEICFEVCDIKKTSICPLAKVMRRELKKRGVENLKVVYSKAPIITPENHREGERKQTPASISYVPSSAGLMIAGEIIKDIINTAKI